MYNFPQIPATKRSLSSRKPVHGFGINDSDYMVQPVINGKQIKCPIYFIWNGMIERCYSIKSRDRYPTYIDCSVSNEWMRFSKFKEWAIKQDWEGKHLDKDILFTDNKIYSKKACLFVTRDLNNLLASRENDRGSLPIGVRDDHGRYQARCNANKKSVTIGTFKTQQKAHAAYLKFKSNHVHEIALQQTDERLKQALIRISGEIARGEYYQ